MPWSIGAPTKLQSSLPYPAVLFSRLAAATTCSELPAASLDALTDSVCGRPTERSKVRLQRSTCRTSSSCSPGGKVKNVICLWGPSDLSSLQCRRGRIRMLRAVAAKHRWSGITVSARRRPGRCKTQHVVIGESKYSKLQHGVSHGPHKCQPPVPLQVVLQCILNVAGLVGAHVFTTLSHRRVRLQDDRRHVHFCTTTARHKRIEDCHPTTWPMRAGDPVAVLSCHPVPKQRRPC